VLCTLSMKLRLLARDPHERVLVAAMFRGAEDRPTEYIVFAGFDRRLLRHSTVLRVPPRKDLRKNGIECLAWRRSQQQMPLDAIERKRIDEAVQTLVRYNKSPFITDYLKKQPAPRISPAKYEKDELRTLVKSILLGEYRGKKKHVLTLEGLTDHLDRLQETGRQHVYLLRFPDDAAPLLARLRDANETRLLIGGEDELYRDGLRVWETSAGPKLALVRRDTAEGTPHRLTLKWVETREFWAPDRPADAMQSAEMMEEEESAEDTSSLSVSAVHETSAETQRVQIRVRHEERAVTFLVINLDSGECELEIQALHGQSRISRREELATYRTILASLFGVELVGPDVLAPAIRRVLVTREVPIVRCSAILPDRGRFIGGKGELPPVDVRSLQAGVTIRFDWPQPSGGVGRVELDGRIDEILILRPLLPEHHERLLKQVRKWRKEGLAELTESDEQKHTLPITQPPITDDDSAVVDSAASLDARIATLKAALRRSRPTASTAQPAIDRAIREYARTHGMEEPTAAPESVAAPGVASSSVPSADDRALEQFLAYIKEVAQSERTTYQRELKSVRGEELWTFRLSVAAAVLALVIVITGAVLLFAGQPVAGTITGLLGALTGGGTVLIRSYAQSLKAKRELLQDRQRDSQQTLLAIQSALSIATPDERARAMSAVALSLLSRVTGGIKPAA
jgi:hypothetical protein